MAIGAFQERGATAGKQSEQKAPIPCAGTKLFDKVRYQILYLCFMFVLMEIMFRYKTISYTPYTIS